MLSNVCIHLTYSLQKRNSTATRFCQHGKSQLPLNQYYDIFSKHAAVLQWSVWDLFHLNLNHLVDCWHLYYDVNKNEAFKRIGFIYTLFFKFVNLMTSRSTLLIDWALIISKFKSMIWLLVSHFNTCRCLIQFSVRVT